MQNILKCPVHEFMYRDTTNVEHEMYDYKGSNWSHRNCNQRFTEKYGSHTRNTFSRLPTKDSYTWNMTHNMERSAAWNLKTKWWWITVGAREVPGRKGLRQENDDDDDDDENDDNDNNVRTTFYVKFVPSQGYCWQFKFCSMWSCHWMSYSRRCEK
jgi:hypothetical protein